MSRRDASLLRDALGVRRGDVVALVGGGGKTSLGLRLVHELARTGWRVIFTVTTRIYPPPLPVVLSGDAPGATPAERIRALVEQVGHLLDQGPVCVAATRTPEGKLSGVAPADVALLGKVADAVIVEADGAAGRPLKFPLAHEPVIPPSATLVVPVAGAEAIGRPLTGEWVHRADAAAEWLAGACHMPGVVTGSPVTPAMVAALLWHPGAATRGRPRAARVVPVINQVDTSERLEPAREVAEALLRLGAARAVLAAALREPPVIDMLEAPGSLLSMPAEAASTPCGCDVVVTPSRAAGRAAPPPGGPLVLIKGAGEMATGAGWRLFRAGFRVVMTDLPHPLAIRRTVAFSEAIPLGEWSVEGVTARRARDGAHALELLSAGYLPVLADPDARCRHAVRPAALVDGIMAKRNTGTRIDDAPAVIALGPGFTAGLDCHAVVETQRGHHLGRVYRYGSALPNTGIPATRGGHGADRVVRAPATGVFRAMRSIGERVEAGDVLGAVVPPGEPGGGVPVRAAIGGVLRGLIRDATPVTAGLKVGDVDAAAEPSWCFTISDKARAVGGGVLEALLSLGVR